MDGCMWHLGTSFLTCCSSGRSHIFALLRFSRSSPFWAYLKSEASENWTARYVGCNFSINQVVF